MHGEMSRPRPFSYALPKQMRQTASSGGVSGSAAAAAGAGGGTGGGERDRCGCDLLAGGDNITTTGAAAIPADSRFCSSSSNSLPSWHSLINSEVPLGSRRDRISALSSATVYDASASTVDGAPVGSKRSITVIFIGQRPSARWRASQRWMDCSLEDGAQHEWRSSAPPT